MYFPSIALATAVIDQVIFVCLCLTSWRQFPLGKENCVCCGAGCGRHSPVWDTGRMWWVLRSREKGKNRTTGKDYRETFTHEPPNPQKSLKEKTNMNVFLVEMGSAATRHSQVMGWNRDCLWGCRRVEVKRCIIRKQTLGNLRNRGEGIKLACSQEFWNL